jgi:hypothetical protein
VEEAAGRDRLSLLLLDEELDLRAKWKQRRAAQFRQRALLRRCFRAILRGNQLARAEERARPH